MVYGDTIVKKVSDYKNFDEFFSASREAGLTLEELKAKSLEAFARKDWDKASYYKNRYNQKLKRDKAKEEAGADSVASEGSDTRDVSKSSSKSKKASQGVIENLEKK